MLKLPICLSTLLSVLKHVSPQRAGLSFLRFTFVFPVTGVMLDTEQSLCLYLPSERMMRWWVRGTGGCARGACSLPRVSCAAWPHSVMLTPRDPWGCRRLVAQSPSLWKVWALQEEWNYWHHVQIFLVLNFTRENRGISLNGNQETFITPLPLPSDMVTWELASKFVGGKQLIRLVWRHQSGLLLHSVHGLSPILYTAWVPFSSRQKFSSDLQGQNKLQWKRAARGR